MSVFPMSKKADLFMCILGDRYGYPISIERIPKEFSDFRISLMPEAASDPMISFLELEILTACLYLPHSMCFLIRSGVHTGCPADTASFCPNYAKC